jgi:tRNA/rRNA methyltransferase
MAPVGAEILRRAELFPSLREALAGAVYVLGTTARGRRWRDSLGPSPCAAKALQQARTGRVAIVFGPEDMGLSNEELELCNDVVTIPTAGNASSLNIAQAVLLICYELFSACEEPREEAADIENPAPVAMTEALYDHLRESLLEVGFLNPQKPDHILGMIRRLLSRSGLSVPEVRMLRGLFRQLVWYIRHSKAERAGPPRES